ELLSRIGAFRSPVDYDAISAISRLDDRRATKAAVRDLVARGLLLFHQQQHRYDLHPIVRQYAYDRLTDRQSVHTSLRDYFAAVPQPETREVERVEGLEGVIELYHHTVGAGRYDDAQELLRGRLLPVPLYYRFGAYQTCIELLLALFAHGEDKPPRLTDESAQAWALNSLANSYSFSGQPRRAVPLFDMHNEIRATTDSKMDLAIGLGNLATQRLVLGELEAAERNVRRRIELCREIEDGRSEAIGHRELGRLLAYRGEPDEADAELAQSTAYFKRMDYKQSLCLAEAYRALSALLTGEPAAALDAALRTREFWQQDAEETYPVERDFVHAERLLGCALVELAAVQTDRHDEHLTEAEEHLTDALSRCRRINLVELEPDILLAWARWHRLRGDTDVAHDRAREALSIADRCEYRLKQAEIHNFLAQLALDADDRAAAEHHARTAHERAWCDGPPHCYKPALDQAAATLEQLGIDPEGQQPR
ncbi:MAG: hypothetical protein ACYSWU_06280, partial [Planctomycetota bacterium]